MPSTGTGPGWENWSGPGASALEITTGLHLLEADFTRALHLPALDGVLIGKFAAFL